MNSIIRLIILAFLFFFSGTLRSQETFTELDEVYGLDPKIYNGKKYSYFLPSGTGGHQFLYSPEFTSGELVIRGPDNKPESRVANNRFFLNYDVYNQKLLLQYPDEKGSFQIIEVSTAWLERFYLGDSVFEYRDFDQESRFYQVIGNGRIRVYYYWWKKLKLDNSNSPAHYSFSKPFKDSFVMINGELRPFSSNGSFIKLFDPALKPEIKIYLKNKKINLGKATDIEMTELINTISNLY